MRKTEIALAAGLLAGMVAPASATNWLELQGTEPAGSTDRFKPWGFIQPQYSYTSNSKLPAGPWKGQKAAFNQIGPDLKSSSTFHLRRARFGARGANFPLDSKTNYFLLFEAGRNGITKFGDSDVAPTDASITLNQIPHARIRLGQFKYPGSEEGLQAIHVFNYINFTVAGSQLLLERFFDGDGSNPNDKNEPNGSVGAYRDIGIQVFDWFNYLGWEHSYAVMLGNGNGINRTDDNNNKNYYLYWASEKIFGGKGGRREGLKFFGWYQKGDRTLKYVNNVADEEDFERERWGFGTTLRKGKWRGAAEYFKADGMIFNGTDGGAVPGNVGANGVTASFNMAPKGRADGWYVDLGYRVIPRLELDVRYDYLDRLKNDDAQEREFDNLTLGLQWFFNKKTRALVNYEIRNAKAPNASSSAPPNQILDEFDNRLALQVLTIF